MGGSQVRKKNGPRLIAARSGCSVKMHPSTSIPFSTPPPLLAIHSNSSRMDLADYLASLWSFETVLLTIFYFLLLYSCSGFCLLPNYPLSRHILNHIRLSRSHLLSCPVICHITPCILHHNFSFFLPFFFMVFFFSFSLVQCQWAVSPPPSPTHRVRCWTR